MDKPKKYKIEEEMNKLTLRSYKAASRLIPKHLNIAFNTFHNYRKLPLNGKGDIPYATVRMLEGVFGMESGTLANYPIELKSLDTLIQEEHKNRSEDHVTSENEERV